MAKRRTAFGLRRAVPGIEGAEIHHISDYQYNKAWDMVSTGSSPAQIMAATNLTRRQLDHLMKKGLPHREGRPAFHQRFHEQITAMRKRALEAAEAVSSEGLDALKDQMKNVQLAQKTTQMILHTVGLALSENAKRDKPLPMEAVLPSEDVTKLLKAIQPHTDVGKVAEAFRKLYEAPAGTRNPISGGMPGSSGDFNPDVALPASLAMLDEMHADDDLGIDSGTDVLDELLPERLMWSDAERAHFEKTGERPERDYKPPEKAR